MPMQQQDVIVLGAGIVGVSTALHLQARGRSVLLIDKGEPGEGTSYGNAGLIERSSVIPYSFPQGLWNLLRYGMNRRSDVRYDPLYLPRIARWLFQYWRESSPERLKIATQAMLPLVEASVREHDFLVQQAGCAKLIRAQAGSRFSATRPLSMLRCAVCPICSGSIFPMTFWTRQPFASAKPPWARLQAAFTGSIPKQWSIPVVWLKLMPIFSGGEGALSFAAMRRASKPRAQAGR